MELSDKRCVPCRGGIQAMGAEEAGRLISQVSGWTLEEETKGIRREFRFRNFADAMGFARQVGEIAEAEGHHPDLSVGWGYCTVRFRTHSIRGLHENDFIMAAKVNRLL
ncbi:MAG: pterin-4-alpha-carbinolamine dehydratase [Deltaproteobacteria bacterium]|nr:pterin-4-alpha-carbinolamine dehydratase [Deltaproteobacteria bacterium]MBP2683349.1 pterin-4-alpha-carbinolamine dehydratase [Deltaproteobacteria bacterium]MBP2685894.1 pterin-4-alpha-carbinolamine dehydratase [Deltaproteobacteria bacterium]